jgi:hypothetical protein
MIGKPFTDKKLIELLKNNSSSFGKDKKGHLVSINLIAEKVGNKNDIVTYIQNEFSFLKEYGYLIEEIIYSPHMYTPSMIYVSFLKPIKEKCNFGEVLYARK